MQRMSETIPRYTLGRLQNLRKSVDRCVIDLCNSERVNTYEQKCLDILGIASVHEALLYTNDQRVGDLYNTIDGRALSIMKKHNTGQNWQMYSPSYISGKSFINLCKLRIGKLRTKENSSRGRDSDKKCRKCVRVNESLNHILSSCHFTHFARIQRHNKVAELFIKACQDIGTCVLEEPYLVVNEQLHKPDLIVIHTNTATIIDFSIVTEHQQMRHQARPTTIKDQWLVKRNKYDTPAINDHVKHMTTTDTVHHGAIIISVRGIWCKSNDQVFKDIGVPLKIRELMVVRAMEYSVRVWNTFMREA